MAFSADQQAIVQFIGSFNSYKALLEGRGSSKMYVMQMMSVLALVLALIYRSNQGISLDPVGHVSFQLAWDIEKY